MNLPIYQIAMLIGVFFLGILEVIYINFSASDFKF